jgi:hypothetical protein
VIPWIILALVAVPLLIVGFLGIRRGAVVSERPATENPERRTETEREFAEAEAYEAKWRDEDEERYHGERLP